MSIALTDKIKWEESGGVQKKTYNLSANHNKKQIYITVLLGLQSMLHHWHYSITQLLRNQTTRICLSQMISISNDIWPGARITINRNHEPIYHVYLFLITDKAILWILSAFLIVKDLSLKFRYFCEARDILLCIYTTSQIQPRV